MRRTFIAAAVAALMILSGAVALAQGMYPAFPSPGPYTLGNGYFAAKEPGKTFHEARQNFLDEEYKIAAEEIRKGVALLKVEAIRGTKKGNMLLMHEAEQLEKLAQKVETGAVDSSRDLDDAFGRAHQALARQYIYTAAEAWAKKDAALTGRYLMAATYHFAYAIAWSGRRLESAALAGVRQCKSVAKKIIDESDVLADDVNKSLETMKDKIKWLQDERYKDS